MSALTHQFRAFVQKFKRYSILVFVCEGWQDDRTELPSDRVTEWGKLGNMVNPPSEQFQLSQKLAIFRDKKKITKSDLNHIYQMYETKVQ